VGLSTHFRKKKPKGRRALKPCRDKGSNSQISCVFVHRSERLRSPLQKTEMLHKPTTSRPYLHLLTTIRCRSRANFSFVFSRSITWGVFEINRSPERQLCAEFGRGYGRCSRPAAVSRWSALLPSGLIFSRILRIEERSLIPVREGEVEESWVFGTGPVRDGLRPFWAPALVYTPAENRPRHRSRLLRPTGRWLHSTRGGPGAPSVRAERTSWPPE